MCQNVIEVYGTVVIGMVIEQNDTRAPVAHFNAGDTDVGRIVQADAPVGGEPIHLDLGSIPCPVGRQAQKSARLAGTVELQFLVPHTPSAEKD